MRHISYSNRFKKDVDKAIKRGKNISKLKDVMELLINNKNLFKIFNR